MRTRASPASWPIAALSIAAAAIAPLVFAQPTQNTDPEAFLPPLIDRPDRIIYKSDYFSFVRVVYSDTSGFGNTFLVDYPEADRAFIEALRRYTPLSVQPQTVMLRLTDPGLGQFPFLYLVEGGRLQLSEEEAIDLRRYLLAGGFLMVDDLWGAAEWNALAEQMRRVFPERAPAEIPESHEVFRSYFQIDELPPIPGIRELLSAPDSTAPDDQPRVRGLFDDRGRLMAIFLHNMDFGDAWEHSDEPTYPSESSLGGAIPMGINIVVYALSH